MERGRTSRPWRSMVTLALLAGAVSLPGPAHAQVQCSDHRSVRCAGLRTRSMPLSVPPVRIPLPPATE